MADNEIMIVDEKSLKDKIYIVRGIQVMFDFDLADEVLFPISFDSRVIPISREDIPNYFRWRQDEAWRNCVNAYGIWALKQERSQ